MSPLERILQFWTKKDNRACHCIEIIHGANLMHDLANESKNENLFWKFPQFAKPS